MKKTIASLLAIAILLSITACTSSSSSLSDGENRSEPLTGPDDSVVDRIVGTLNATTYPRYTDWWSEGCDLKLSEGYAEMHICAKAETVLWDIYDRFSVPLWFESSTGMWEMGPEIVMNGFTTDVDYSRLYDYYYYVEDDYSATISFGITILDVDPEKATVSIDGWRSVEYYASYKDDVYENLSGTYSFEKDNRWKYNIEFKINDWVSMKITDDTIWVKTGLDGLYPLFQADK